MSKIKIVFIQRQFSHYRKAIFDELSKSYQIYLLHGGVEPTINEAYHAPYAKMVNFIKYWKKETNVFLFVFKDLLKIKPDIVIHEANPSILSLIFVLIYCHLTHKKFVLWGHGYNRNYGFNPYSNIKSLIRLWFMKISDAIIFYDNTTRNEIKKYVPENKLFVAQNTLDTKKLLYIRRKLENKGKSSLKKELGFESDYNLVYLGRLISEKKPFETLKLFEIIRCKFKEKTFSLHIIGDGPEFSKIYNYINNNNLNSKIKLYGNLYDDEEISKILYASDILINPGYVGLNVNHALYFFCPIFTFYQGPTGPFHSPEIEFVIEGETGFFSVPFNYEEMAEKIIYYLKTEELQNFVEDKIKNITEKIITLENMINGFHECFKYLGNNEK